MIDWYFIKGFDSVFNLTCTVKAAAEPEKTEAFLFDTNFLIFDFCCSRILDSLLDTNIRFLKLNKHTEKCSEISSRIKQSPPFHGNPCNSCRKQQANLVRGKGKYYPQPRVTQKTESDLKLTAREGTWAAELPASRRYTAPAGPGERLGRALEPVANQWVSHSELGGGWQ